MLKIEIDGKIISGKRNRLILLGKSSLHTFQSFKLKFFLEESGQDVLVANLVIMKIISRGTLRFSGPRQSPRAGTRLDSISEYAKFYSFRKKLAGFYKNNRHRILPYMHN